MHATGALKRNTEMVMCSQIYLILQVFVMGIFSVPLPPSATVCLFFLLQGNLGSVFSF